MEIEALGNQKDGRLKHSNLGMIAFICCLGAVAFIFFDLYSSLNGLIADLRLRMICGFIPVISAAASLITAVVDLFQQNRRKVLPIIALVISGLLAVIFLFILGLLTQG